MLVPNTFIKDNKLTLEKTKQRCKKIHEEVKKCNNPKRLEILNKQLRLCLTQLKHKRQHINTLKEQRQKIMTIKKNAEKIRKMTLLKQIESHKKELAVTQSIKKHHITSLKEHTDY